jgi:hypothetical protein
VRDKWMTWTDFMKMCHEGPGLPREVLDEVARLEEEMPADEEDDDCCKR